MNDKHIDYASPEDIPEKLDEDTKAKLRKYLESKKSDGKSWDRRCNKISKKVCKLINEMKDEGVAVSTILSYIPAKSENTVYYHLGKDCSHEYRIRVTYDECCRMRMYSRKGARTSTLAILFDLNRRSVMRHLRGHCSHEDGFEPLSAEEARWSLHMEPDTTISTCPICGDDFKHKEYRERTTCSPQCNAVYASEAAKDKVLSYD